MGGGMKFFGRVRRDMKKINYHRVRRDMKKINYHREGGVKFLRMSTRKKPMILISNKNPKLLFYPDKKP